MTSRPDKNPPALVITSAEIAAVTAPFVVAYDGRTYALRNPNSLAVDDLMAADKVAETSILDALTLVAEDEDVTAWLKSLPWTFLQRVFEAWSVVAQVAPGEGDGSGTSSDPTPSE